MERARGSTGVAWTAVLRVPGSVLDFLTTDDFVGIVSNMPADPLLNERHVLDEETFVEIVAWRVPSPVKGSQHRFKYRLALVKRGICVLRYDNETGKGDHRHVAGQQESYVFSDTAELLEDFWADVETWRKR